MKWYAIRSQKKRLENTVEVTHLNEDDEIITKQLPKDEMPSSLLEDDDEP